MELKVKKTHPNATIPRRATEGAAGYDLSAALDESIVIPPGGIQVVSTGIALELPSCRYVALMIARSSLALKHGVTLANSVGVIDSDYRGSVSMVLKNSSKQPFKVENGDRLAQLLILPVIHPEVVEVLELGKTERNTGGFGSTGVK